MGSRFSELNYAQNEATWGPEDYILTYAVKANRKNRKIFTPNFLLVVWCGVCGVSFGRACPPREKLVSYLPLLLLGHSGRPRPRTQHRSAPSTPALYKTNSLLSSLLIPISIPYSISTGHGPAIWPVAVLCSLL